MSRPVQESGRHGNFITEYFGYEVYPHVIAGEEALRVQSNGECPFLTMALASPKTCIKPSTARGICTIDTAIDGNRYEWLVCPNRAIDDQFMRQAAGRLFGYAPNLPMHFVAAPTLQSTRTRDIIRAGLAANEKVIVYFQEKLGGELSIGKTQYSPEFSFDWTFLEVSSLEPEITLGRFAVLEIQTMDFHGSYRHALQDMEGLLQENPEAFHDALTTPEGIAALSKKVEGPNLSNVFKRTFYQMAYKFQLSGHHDCAGAAFAIPKSVWESWARHLGNPTLSEAHDGTFFLESSGGEDESPEGNSWIFVFELSERSDPSYTEAPRSVKPWKVIKTDAKTIVNLALNESPAKAIQDGGPLEALKNSARKRIKKYWPEVVTTRRRSQARRPSSTPDGNDQSPLW